MVRGHTPSIFTHDLYIPEIFRPRGIFLLLIVWVYLQAPKQPYGCTRKFKVIEIGINVTSYWSSIVTTRCFNKKLSYRRETARRFIIC